ncbi:MAG: amidase [Nevskia sp.]|nr:amidase [Nevskia sp.]
MLRRLRLIAPVGALATVAACSSPAPQPSTGTTLATTPAIEARSALPALEDASLATLQGWLAEGRISSRDLVAFHLARIAALDRGEHGLHAVIEVNPGAMAIAELRDAERKAGQLRGPLHGIPVLVKDNIATIGTGLEAMETTAGSLALVGHRPSADAFVVERLRAAGAIILGKTNLSEWANWRSTHAISGWSARGGQTRNPYARDRNPCGSSSGSGVAVAASLAPVAIGTETDGSIVCPSAVNGIVGLKPTRGRVSRSGIIPIADSQDTAGPMARSVADAALLLDVISGRDTADAATAALTAKRAAECFHCALDGASLKGVRIGVLRSMSRFLPSVEKRFDDAIAALKAAGAVIVDDVVLPHADDYTQDEFDVLAAEFKDGVERYLAGLDAGAPKRLADLIAFNADDADRELPSFGQELFKLSAASPPATDPKIRKARARALKLAGVDGIDAALKKDRLDVLIAPTGSPAWLTDHTLGDHFVGGNVSTAPAVAGYPHLTVPMGFVDGLPVGLSFVGPAWSEARLLRYGHAYERYTAHRRAPTMAAHAKPDRPATLDPDAPAATDTER